MKRIGQLVFLAAVAVAAALYALTVPDGLPWNNSSHLALAYLGEIVGYPDVPRPFWGFHVRVLGSAVALSVCMAALAAGLLAAVVNRYWGWRFALGFALVWIFLPGVWNRAITGERSVCLAAMAIVAAWTLNAVLLWVFRKALAMRRVAPTTVHAEDAAPAATEEVRTWRQRMNLVVSWGVLGLACVFALVSLTVHDYRLGEPATAFARGVANAAGERIIVLNGVCDDQLAHLVAEKPNGQAPAENHSLVFLRNDDAYRTNLVTWAKREWPNETNVWVAAQVSASAFVDVVTKRHPERFYLMNGKSTTLETWEKRWSDFKPYLDSDDPFVRVARKVFGVEGNAVANALADANDRKSAWLLYKRIYEEVDPGNFSSLVNQNELIRRGYEVSGSEKKLVQDKLETFFKDVNNRKRMKEIVRAAGPVRSDPVMLEKMAADAKKRIAAKIASGETVEVAPEVLTLVEWNNEMVQLMDKGELVKAGRIARAILSNPRWRGFIPANAVMGTVSANEGDYVASEAFFRVATDTTNRVASVTLNDFADTLMQLGKLDEAEKVARRTISESQDSFWLVRLTLVEILEKKVAKLERTEVVENGEKTERYVKVKGADKIEAEISELLKTVLKNAPASNRERIRKAHKDFVKQ